MTLSATETSKNVIYSLSVSGSHSVRHGVSGELRQLRPTTETGFPLMPCDDTGKIFIILDANYKP